MLFGEEAEGGQAVGAVFGVEVDADEVVRGPSAGEAVAGGPRGGGEHTADGERVGARVVYAVPEPAALAAAGRDLGMPAVWGPEGRKFVAGQWEDGVAAFGGKEGVVERRGVRIRGFSGWDGAGGSDGSGCSGGSGGFGGAEGEVRRLGSVLW